MASEMDRLADEMASLVSRIEQMERNSRTENRTSAGLIVPKGVTVEPKNMAEVERQIGSIHRRLNGVEEVLSRIVKVQRRQQDAIEEMAIMGAYTLEEAA